MLILGHCSVSYLTYLFVDALINGKNLLGSEVSRKFRVVRDNRVNQNADGEIKPASLQHQASSAAEQVNSNGPEKG